MQFDTITAAELQQADRDAIDTAPFGIIGFGESGEVDVYSATESRMAGLSTDKVIGKHLFQVVAPCMNNYMVASRFEEEPALDDVIDYVLTLRMRPTRVKLRLLKEPGVHRRYLLVQRG